MLRQSSSAFYFQRLTWSKTFIFDRLCKYLCTRKTNLKDNSFDRMKKKPMLAIL